MRKIGRLLLELSKKLDELDKQASSWLDQCKRATKAVESLRKAIAVGNLRDLEKLRQTAQQASGDIAGKAEICETFSVSAAEYLGLGGAFVSELMDAATHAGVKLYERDGVIYCYPVLLRAEPDLSCVRIDKKLEPTLRPYELAQILKKLQSREPKAKPERFIETVFEAYELVCGKSSVPSGGDVALSDIYSALTLLPGSEKEYTLMDFTRDIYFLDISGVQETKKGAIMSLPASTVTRERKTKLLPFVDRNGQEKLYALVRFTPNG
jgi:hypothetical protein